MLWSLRTQVFHWSIWQDPHQKSRQDSDCDGWRLSQLLSHHEEVLQELAPTRSKCRMPLVRTQICAHRLVMRSGKSYADVLNRMTCNSVRGNEDTLTRSRRR